MSDVSNTSRLTSLGRPIRVLFVCIENAGRSQMAQAFAKMAGADAYSAGSRPSGRVNPVAIEVMWEVGYDLKTHESKSLERVPQEEYDYVVTMGCGDACPFIPARQRIDWQIPDPKGKSLEDVRGIRDQIRNRVEDLLQTTKPL